MHALAESFTSFLTALIKHPLNADNIYNDLSRKGYKQEDITLMMSLETQKKYFSNELSCEDIANSKILQSMGISGAVDGPAGAITAALAEAASVGTVLVIPEIGIVAAGPLVTSLAEGGARSAGGIIGMLIGAEIPLAEVKKYEKGIKEGGVVIGVSPLSSNDYTPRTQGKMNEFLLMNIDREL